MTKTSIAVKRIETQLLEEFLRTVEINQEVSYEELSKVCKANVTAEARSWLATARKNIENELKTCFVTLTKFGIKRLTPADHAIYLSSIRKQAGKRIKKEFNRSFNVKWEGLSQESKDRVNLERTVLQFMAESAKEKAVKKLESKVKDSSHALPSKEALEILVNNT